jgi:hypothetical protein
MAFFFLLTSAVLFIATYGIHSIIIKGNLDNRPNLYLNPLLAIIPYFSGFVFPLIPLKIVFDYNLILLFIINLIVVFILSPIFANILLSIFVNQRRGEGEIMAFSFIGGIVLLILWVVFE